MIEEPGDPLHPARGIAYGLILGLICWAFIILGIFAYFQLTRPQPMPPTWSKQVKIVPVHDFTKTICYRCHKP